MGNRVKWHPLPPEMMHWEGYNITFVTPDHKIYQPKIDYIETSDKPKHTIK